MAFWKLETSAPTADMRGISDVDYTRMQGWVSQSMIDGINAVVSMLSSINFSSDWTAERIQLSQSVRVLEGMINCAKLNDTPLLWFTTEVGETLDDAKSMSAHEFQLNVKYIGEKSLQIVALLEKAMSLREEKQKVLEMQAKAAKMRAAFEARKLEFQNEERRIHAKLRGEIGSLNSSPLHP